MDAITSRLWNICFANDDEYVSTDVTAPLLKLPNWTHHPIYILIRITAGATSEAGSAYPELSHEIIRFFYLFFCVFMLFICLYYSMLCCVWCCLSVWFFIFAIASSVRFWRMSLSIPLYLSLTFLRVLYIFLNQIQSRVYVHITLLCYRPEGYLICHCTLNSHPSIHAYK